MSRAQIQVKVEAKQQVAAAICEFTLSPVDAALVPFSPGSHVVVEIPAESKTWRNAYSLLSDPNASDCYRIAVRLQDNSRGGSIYMHEKVEVGDRLTITPPANLFAPDWSAKKHVLIAAGVGITPFMSYLPELHRRGADTELHYLYRGSVTGAYREQLQEQLGNRFFSYDSEQSNRCDIRALLHGHSLGTHFYICGPESLIVEFKKIAYESGVPDASIHYEKFSAPQAGTPFVVQIASSGRTVAVAEDETMLEALEAAGIDIPNLCRGGVCGQCLCPVVEGEPEHRDSFLSDIEKSSGRAVMACVSRAKSKRLVVDIEE